MTTPVVSLQPDIIPHFTDSNGALLSGGKVFVYAAGTTTKINSYTDNTGATPNTNPIILNTRGEPATGAGVSCGIWLTPGTAYKFVLSPSTDTDPPTNPYWTIDNIVSGGTVIYPFTLSGNMTQLVTEIGQGSPYTQSYALAAFASTTTQPAAREYMVSMNLTSNTGSGGPELGTDKVTLYTAVEGQAGSGDIWAFNPLALMDSAFPATSHVQVIEVDLVNNQANRTTGTNPSIAITTAGASTGTVYTNYASHLISGPGAAAVFQYGIIANNASIAQVCFADGTNSLYSYQVVGSTTHTTGMSLQFGAYTQSAIQLPNANGGIRASNAAGSGDFNVAVVDASNELVLGDNNLVGGGIRMQNNTVAYSDNAFTCGGSGARWSVVWAATGAINTSDASLKKDIAKLPSMAEFVASVDPVSYKWIEGGKQMVPGKVKKTVIATKSVTSTQDVIRVINGVAVKTQEDVTQDVADLDALPVMDANGNPVMRTITIGKAPGGGRITSQVPELHHVRRMVDVEVDGLVEQSVPGKRTHFGFLARDVKAAMDKAGIDFGAYVKDETGIEHLRPDQMIPVLWKAVQELQAELSSLKNGK